MQGSLAHLNNGNERDLAPRLVADLRTASKRVAMPSLDSGATECMPATRQCMH